MYFSREVGQGLGWSTQTLSSSEAACLCDQQRVRQSLEVTSHLSWSAQRRSQPPPLPSKGHFSIGSPGDSGPGPAAQVRVSRAETKR